LAEASSLVSSDLRKSKFYPVKSDLRISGIVHKEHMDLQTQEERYGLEIVDLTHTYQYGESESPLLEIPLMD
jgi:hypothetical protein